MSLKKKILLFLGMVAIQICYLPTNRLMTGGVSLKIPLDDSIPVIAWWVFPYLCVFIIWVGAPIWAAFRMDDDMFRAFIASGYFTLTIGMLCFILYPTYVVRGPVLGDDFAANFLRQLYSVDNVHNAFPSGHIYITGVICLYYARWYKKSWPIFALTLVIVILSTLFTHQHFILDLVGGLILMVIGYKFGIWYVYERGKRIKKTIFPQRGSRNVKQVS